MVTAEVLLSDCHGSLSDSRAVKLYKCVTAHRRFLLL